MKKFNFQPLVNVRLQKDETSENVFTTTTTGGFRVPPKAAKVLGIGDYDAVSLFSDTDEESGKTSVFIAKGHPGTILRDDEGNIVTGERNITQYSEEDPINGALVRESNAGSKILAITSTASWKTLGGGKDKELVLALEPLGVMEYPLPSGDIVEGEVFQLVVVKERAVVAKEKAEKADAVAEDADVAAAIEEEGYEEEIV